MPLSRSDLTTQSRLTALEAAPAYASTNLEPDGSFESSAPTNYYSSFFNSNGTAVYQGALTHSGNQAWRATLSTTTAYIRLGNLVAIPVNPGDTIEITYYAYLESGTATGEIGMLTSDTAASADYFGTGVNQQGISSAALTTGAWVKLYYRGTVPAGHYYMRVYTSLQASTASVITIDDRVTRRVQYDSAASGSGVVAQVACSTNLTLTTTATLVPGMTYTVPTGGAGSYAITATLDFAYTITGDEAATLIGNLYVGATVQAGEIDLRYPTSSNVGARFSVSQTWAVTLADGDVVQIRARKTSGSGTSLAQTPQSHMVLMSAKGSQGATGLTGAQGVTGSGVLSSGSVSTNTTATTAGAIPGSATTIATNTVTVTAGRRYKITTNFFGFTATSVATIERYTLSYTTSGATVAVVGPNNMTFWTVVSQGVQPGLVHVAYYTCSVGGSLTINETLSHSGGTSTTITCAANGGQMVIEDVGT